MKAFASPVICVVMPSSKVDGPMFRLHKSKSRTSLLADLIATDDDVEQGTDPNGNGDITRWVLPYSFKDSNPKLMLQELLGDFFIDPDALEKKELLGEGGFAVVHRCLYYDLKKGKAKSVAMKELKSNLLESVEDLREFVMEASLQRKLHHRNIVRSLGIGATDFESMNTMRRSMFVLQEYVPGKSLKEMVIQQMCNRNERVYSMKSAVKWLLDIASALHYLHDVCRPMIVHRDLKLDNILLSHNGKSAKLCDFGLHKRLRTCGIAAASPNEAEDSYYGGMLYQSLMDRAVDEPSQGSGELSLTNSKTNARDLTLSAQLSLSGNVQRSAQSSKSLPSSHSPAVNKEASYSERPSREPHVRVGFTGKVGSVVYMAPEVFLNKPYDEKVDVYSFGVMMYELLAQVDIAVKYGMQEEHGSLNGYADKVAKGFRETIPSQWPEYVKLLVAECWDQDPANRPSFKDITLRLSFILDSGIAENMGRPLINMNLVSFKCCCIQ